MASKTTYQLDVLLGASTSPTFQGVINRAADGIETLNSTAKRVAAGITAVFAAVNLTRMVEDAVDTYMEFEQEMATVSSIAQATRSEYERMEEASLAAGRSTIYTATESASALEYMTLAGWDVNTSIDAQIPILRLAAATQKDLGTTADLVTDSMNALQLEVGALDEYLNKLIVGNNNANTTAEQLMQALVKTGGASRVLGADLDDTITALGILANNGLKGEESGTALNSIFTRIASNSAALKELENIGVSIFDENGSFIGFEETLIAINDAMADFTDEQKTMSLGKIAGTRRYSQFAYLLDAVVRDAETGAAKWQELEEEIRSSGGALIDMYSISTDTLLNAQAILNSTKEDMQIRVVDVFSDDAKDFTLWLAEKLPEATDSIVAFAEAHTGEFADALEAAGGLIEGVWNTGVKAGSWLINHRGAVTGVLAAIATSLAAGKTVDAAKSLMGAVANLANIGTAAWYVAGMAAVAGGVIGIANAIEQAEEKVVALNLAEHFGTVTLTLDELDALAQHIVGERSLGGIADLLDAMSESADTLDRAAGIFRDLHKENWKLEMGFKMTTDDYEDYANQIERYIREVESYAADKGYEVHLATSLLFGDGSLADDEVGAFYARLQEQIEAHGTDLYNFLYDEVSGAMMDGIIDPIENGEIQKRLEEINRITSAITEAENSAKFDTLTLQYDGTDLDGESIIKLLEDLGQYSEEVQEGAREAYRTAMTSSYARLKLDDEYSHEDFERDKEAAWLAYHKKSEEAALNSATYMLDTLRSGYSGLGLSDALQQYRSVPQEIMDKYLDEDNEDIHWMWDNAPQTVMNSIQSEMYDRMSEFAERLKSTAPEDLKGLQKYIGSMADVIEMLEKESEEIQRVGGKLDPQTQGILSYWQDLSDMVFMDAESMENALDGYMSPGGQLAEFINEYHPDANWLLPVGKGTITWEDSAVKNVVQQAQDVYDKTESALREAYAEGFDVDTTVRLNFDVLAKAAPQMARHEYLPDEEIQLSKAAPQMARHEYLPDEEIQLSKAAPRMIRIASNAQGGIYNSPILTTFAEEGPEAALPLDGSVRAKALWLQAGDILGMYPDKTRDRQLLEWIDNGESNSSQKIGIHIEYNPVVTIQGNADTGNVTEAINVSVDKLKDMIEELIKEQQRVAF